MKIQVTDMQLLSLVAERYKQNKEFAETLDTIIHQLKEPANRSSHKTSKKDERSTIKNVYLIMVDAFIKKLKDKLGMKPEQAKAMKEAMESIFMAGETKKWFLPRNGKESFNTVTFLRSLYYMHSNGFLDGVKYHDSDLTIDVLAHIIKGQCPGEADAEKTISDGDMMTAYKCSSIATFIRTSTNFTEFEKFCSQLKPNK